MKPKPEAQGPASEMGRVGRKLKLPLTPARRQRQTQFESSSSNGSDVTSNLSGHRRHSFLPLREFDQQLGLFFGPFAGFCGSIAVLAPRIETASACDAILAR